MSLASHYGPRTTYSRPPIPTPWRWRSTSSSTRAREGACLDAISKEPTVYAEDLADDQRWPVFGPQAAALGMRSLLSCRLSANGTHGTLNLYAALPRAYGVIDRTKALIFAAHTGIALGVAEAREDAALSLDIGLHRIDELIAALGIRETIGQAEGILIEHERITPDQAFDVCAEHLSTSTSRDREVAAYVVETGEVPYPIENLRLEGFARAG